MGAFNTSQPFIHRSTPLRPGPVSTVSAMETSRLSAIPLWALERRSPETAGRLRELIKKRVDFGRDPA